MSLSVDEILSYMPARREIFVYDTLDSTNTRAMLLASQGEPEGTVVVADSQTGGKGRFGRSWISPPGVNLYMSVILRPPVPAGKAWVLTFLGALAVIGAIERLTGLRARGKWPNDVFLKGKKTAGVLAETSSGSGGIINYLVLGIGVNLNLEVQELPEDLRSIATSVTAHYGRTINRSLFAAELINRLDDMYADFLLKGPGHIIESWKDKSNQTYDSYN